MLKNSRSGQAALAAMVVAVMTMSAVSAHAANRQVVLGGGQKAQTSSVRRILGDSYRSLRVAASNTLIRYWEPFGELPIINMPRGGSSK